MKIGLVALLACALALPARAADDLNAAAAAAGHELAAALLAAKDRAGISVIAAPAFAESGAGAAGKGAAAAAAAGARLSADAHVNVLDRQKLAAVLGEARLEAALKGEDAQRAGAQAVLVGSVTDSGGSLLLQARLVLTASGKVLASAQKTATVSKTLAGAVESQSIEVAMRKLADGLAAGFEKLPGNARYRRLAVLPFHDVGEQAEKRRIGTIVTAEIATDLRRDHGLLLVERARLSEVMGEIKLGQTGAVDAASAPQIGKLADAQALVIGTASDLGDRYLVDARVVGTENGETLAAESASVNALGMVALASDAVVLRSRKDAMFRSLLIPGWGQIYNRQAVKGGIVLGSEVALLASGIAFHLAGESAYSQYRSQTSAGQLGQNPTAQAQALYDTATSRYRVRNVLMFSAIGLWAANVADAYLSGVDGDQLLGGGVAQRVAVGTDGRSFAARLRW